MEAIGIFRIAELIYKHISGDLSASDREELENWCKSSEERQRLFEKMSNQTFIEKKMIAEQLCDVEKAYHKFNKRQQKYLSYRKSQRIIIAIAASIILIISFQIAFYKQSAEPTFPTAQPLIAAGESHAILTLANGEQMEFRKNMTDTLIQDDGTTVNASGTGVSYTSGETSEKLTYNQLQVPRKGEFQLLLSDGTQVWLNSESYIKYPTYFCGKERRVYLEGEAYFEVTKNSKMPFIIDFGNKEIEVLGTSFNARAYKDEANIYTTLVEGSVKLSSQEKELILHPQEQGIIHSGSGEMEKKQVDVQLYTSWKEGRFIFENQSLEEMMNTLVRWYDVKVVFSDEEVMHSTFTGNLKRYDNLDQMLVMLETTETAHFHQQGDTIFISK
ncbi:MAG: DUF4974 domain-containing protein [Odoribacter sp.]